MGRARRIVGASLRLHDHAASVIRPTHRCDLAPPVATQGLALAWRRSVISKRWPSGSRKNARISQSYVIGGVRNAAPRRVSASYAARQSGTPKMSSVEIVPGSGGGAKVVVG